MIQQLAVIPGVVALLLLAVAQYFDYQDSGWNPVILLMATASSCSTW